MINLDGVLLKELKRRLEGFDELYKFVNDLATWDGTTDSWFNLFKSYQKEAQDLMEKIKCQQS